MYEIVIAVYDTVGHANAAVNILKSAGYAPQDIRVIRRDGHTPNPDFRETGFWHRLFGRDITRHEAEAYSQSAPAGSVVVSIRVRASEAEKVIQLMDANMAAKPLNPARTAGSSGKEPVRVIVPPPTSDPTFSKDK
jgi:hypothetical protein